MKTLQAIVLVLFLSVTNSADAEQITVLQSDGTPASGATFYRLYLDSAGYEYGMMMGMGGGGYDDMMEDSGYGDMMGGMGAGDYGSSPRGMDEMDMMGMGMEMDMGMGGMEESDFTSGAHQVLTLLNGKFVKPRQKLSFDEITADKDGGVELGKKIRNRRGVKEHAMPSLVFHSSGISFIPSDTKFASQVTLRSGGTIIVKTPAGVDPKKYHVLTCWQNGFAYPSLGGYLTELGPSQKIGSKVDASDWRFKPQFRIYQTAKLDTPVEVPPGEVRVTIIPADLDGNELAQKNPAELLRLLVNGGPSTIALAVNQNGSPQEVEFPPLRTLRCRLPKKQETTFPDWGDEPEQLYRVEPFRRIATGDVGMLTVPEAKDVSSRRSVIEFLHRMRSERAAYQRIREGVPVDQDHVQFNLLRPGFYLINRYDQDGTETHGLPVVQWDQSSEIAVGQLVDRKIKGVDGAFQLKVVGQNQATFVSDPSVRKVLQQRAEGQKSDGEKLKLVQSLRSEIDKTIQRLVAQRKRLVALEQKLTGKPIDPFANPGSGVSEMGVPGVDHDPFGQGTPGGDPFGTSNGDPFGTPSRGGNPFGSQGENAPSDPFG